MITKEEYKQFLRVTSINMGIGCAGENQCSLCIFRYIHCISFRENKGLQTIAKEMIIGNASLKEIQDRILQCHWPL